MKLGIISDLRNPQHPRFHRPWVQHYHEFLDFIVQLEDLGFEEVVFPEHHFEPDGYIPNPIPMMTAVAMKTKHMLVEPRTTPRSARERAMEDRLSWDEVSQLLDEVKAMARGLLRHEHRLTPDHGAGPDGAPAPTAGGLGLAAGHVADPAVFFWGCEGIEEPAVLLGRVARDRQVVEAVFMPPYPTGVAPPIFDCTAATDGIASHT